jgi:hypothetical protein
MRCIDEGTEHCWHYYIGYGGHFSSAIESRKWCCFCGDDQHDWDKSHGPYKAKYPITP